MRWLLVIAAAYLAGGWSGFRLFGWVIKKRLSIRERRQFMVWLERKRAIR